MWASRRNFYFPKKQSACYSSPQTTTNPTYRSMANLPQQTWKPVPCAAWSAHARKALGGKWAMEQDIWAGMWCREFVFTEESRTERDGHGSPDGAMARAGYVLASPHEDMPAMRRTRRQAVAMSGPGDARVKKALTKRRRRDMTGAGSAVPVRRSRRLQGLPCLPPSV
jgi:hypothetical protein